MSRVGRGFCSSATRVRAFTLIELVVVVSIVGLLLALSTPSLLTLGPNRKTAIHEMSGQLALARAEALTTQSPVYMVFATAAVKNMASPFRSYALYSDAPGGLSQISPWHTLPEGIVFAAGEHFETSDGIVLRTVQESGSVKEFPIQVPGVTAELVSLPYLSFGSRGEVVSPGFGNRDALHVGIAEGFYENDPPKLMFTRRRPALRGNGIFPQGEILAINSHTGQTRVLSD
jgi:prepilin-type N-terminal cleavage/methylation domain-containing protein